MKYVDDVFVDPGRLLQERIDCLVTLLALRQGLILVSIERLGDEVEYPRRGIRRFE